MGMKVKDIDALREQISKDPRETFTKHQVWLFASEHNKTVPTVEAIPKDQINKAIEKIEQYICDVETDTVKAQGMAQALDIFEQTLGEVKDGTNEKTSN